MEELHCHFFGDEEGEVVAAAASGSDGLVGGASNGSGGWGGSLLWMWFE